MIFFFFPSNVSVILLKEIIASTLFKSAVQNLWMPKHFKGSVAVLDSLL